MESGELIGVLARVLVVVMLGACGDGFWVHLASKTGFGSVGIELELKESKKEVSGEDLAGCSATAPTRGRYSATQGFVGWFGVLSIVLGHY